MLLLLLFVVIVIAIAIWWWSRPKERLRYYVIHLDGHETRRRHIDDMERTLGQPIRKVSAVKGSDISDREFKHVQMHSTHFYNKNELGCYKSHQKAVSLLKHEPCEYAVIFEDDFLIQPDTHETLLQILDDVPDFDFMMIGNDFHDEQPHRTYTVPPRMAGGAHAVLINCSRASTIEHFLKHVTGPIDDRYYDLMLSYTLDGLVVQPSVVKVNTKLLSTLGHF